MFWSTLSLNQMRTKTDPRYPINKQLIINKKVVIKLGHLTVLDNQKKFLFSKKNYGNRKDFYIIKNRTWIRKNN